MINGSAVIPDALRFQRQLEQGLGMLSAEANYRSGEGFTRFQVLPQFLMRDPQRVRGRWVPVFTQLDRRAVFSHGFAPPPELMVTNADVEMGAGLMLSGPTQCCAVFEDGLFERS